MNFKFSLKRWFVFFGVLIGGVILGGPTLSNFSRADSKCNYCEGYKVLEAATKKIPPPTEKEFPNEKHSRIVSSAKVVIDQILLESPELKEPARSYFIKTLAKAAPYDSGNELVDHFWGKIQAYRKELDKTLKDLHQKKEITESEKQRLLVHIALIEGQISEGQDN